MNRADALLHRQADNGGPQLVSAKDSQKKILHLAQNGSTPENIADALAIPKEEVLLVLGINKNRHNDI